MAVPETPGKLYQRVKSEPLSSPGDYTKCDRMLLAFVKNALLTHYGQREIIKAASNNKQMVNLSIENSQSHRGWVFGNIFHKESPSDIERDLNELKNCGCFSSDIDNSNAFDVIKKPLNELAKEFNVESIGYSCDIDETAGMIFRSHWIDVHF